MNYDQLSKLASVFLKQSQEMTNTDPFLSKLTDLKLANNIVENPALMKVVEEMAAKGIPAGQEFNASLAIGKGNGIIISINPPNKIVEASLRKNVIPLIIKATAGLGDLNGFALNNWITGLKWEEG